MTSYARRFGYKKRNLCLWMGVVALLSSGPAYAAAPGSAVIRASRADADFALLGEFVGTVSA